MCLISVGPIDGSRCFLEVTNYAYLKLEYSYSTTANVIRMKNDRIRQICLSIPQISPNI